MRQVIDSWLKRFGYVRVVSSDNDTGSSVGVGTELGESAQRDLDYLFERCGFRAYLVGRDAGFNGQLKSKDSDKSRDVERLLTHYASLGFVFTKSTSYVIGHVKSIPTKDERAPPQRAGLQLVSSSPAPQSKAR